jgi:hypothetical protein
MKGLIYILMASIFISGCSDDANVVIPDSDSKQIVSPPFGYKWGQSLEEFKDGYDCKITFNRITVDNWECRFSNPLLSIEDVDDFVLYFYKGKLVSIEFVIAKSSEGEEIFNEKYNNYLDRMKEKYPDLITVSEYLLRNPSYRHIFGNVMYEKLSKGKIKEFEMNHVYTPDSIDKELKLIRNQIYLIVYPGEHYSSFYGGTPYTSDNKKLSVLYFSDKYDSGTMHGGF